MSNYKTPQEAIAACDAECERSWEEFTKANNLDPSLAPEAFAIAKHVFRQGYMSGARFVSGVIVKKMTDHAQQAAIDPSTTTQP